MTPLDDPTPFTLQTTHGEFRIYLCGDGAPVVVIGGLATAAAVSATRIAESTHGRSVVVIEPPGVGGSSNIEFPTLRAAGEAIREAISILGLGSFPLVSIDLSAALLPHVTDRDDYSHYVALDGASAAGWAATDIRPPDLIPRQDGAHLNALWVFLRDRGLLVVDNPALSRSEGPEYPSVTELSSAFIAAGTHPTAFAQLWNACIDAFQSPSTKLSGILDRSDSAMCEPVLDQSDIPTRATTAEICFARRPESGLWHEYVQTRYGRAHVRRAGTEGFPILVLPTGGGSSAQFAPVIEGLAQGRQVIGIDYFGNGLSDKNSTEGSIADLADEVIAVMDALEIDQADVWGSHTGACIGLELSIKAPERVRRLVMEGPVVVTPEFREDLLTHYFPDFTPDTFGLHLQHIWHWRRDMFMFWPWYRTETSAARKLGIPDPAETHVYAVGILESGITYSRAYRAAFAYPTLERLRHLTTRSIITAGPNDMLANALDDALQSIPEGILDVIPTPTTVWWPNPDATDAEATMDTYRQFINA